MQPTRGASGVVAAPGATRCSPGEQQEQCQQRSQSNTNSQVGAGINSYLPQMQPPSMEQPDSSSIRRSQVHQQGIPNIGLSNLGGGLNVNGAAGQSVPGSCVSGGGGIGAKSEDKAVRFNQKTSIYADARRSGQLVGGEGVVLYRRLQLRKCNTFVSAGCSRTVQANITLLYIKKVTLTVGTYM